jgi:allantoin racemase
MKKVAFLAGGKGPLSPELKRRKAILQSAANPDTVIDMYGGKGSMATRDGEWKPKKRPSGSIESVYDEMLAVPHYIQLCMDAEEENYDAVIISCGSDPGIKAIKEAVNIPIIGPGDSAMHLCSLIGNRFCRLVTHRSGRQRIGLLPFEQHNGLMKWVSSRDIGLTVRDVRGNPDGTLEACIKHGKLAIEQETVDAITYSCMSMAFLEIDEKLSNELQIPVINPAKAAVRIAEMFIDFNITHSKISNPTPFRLK